MRITEDIDPGTQNVIAIRHFLSTYAQERVIWLDGREHPPEEAPHTWMGFSTGEWQGRVLKVRTTHIKQGWHRRNGLPMSDRTTMTEYFFRHGNILSQLSIVEDPIFLEEPLVKTTNLMLDVGGPNQYQAWLFCQADDEVPGRDPGVRAALSAGSESVSHRVCRSTRPARRADARRRGTMLVPGHGRVSDEADLVEYRDMVTIIRDRIQDMVKRGLTLAQIKAANPTMEYDGLYGSAPGWTKDQFVEAVYNSLRPAAPASRE